MPPKRPYKKRGGAKPKAKAVTKAVAKQRQKKVELKDRVSTIGGSFESADLYQNGEGVAPIVEGPTNGPNNVYTIVPETWADPFVTGTENGMIIGTEITPKYLNLKLKLNFDFLRRVVFMSPNGANPHIQRYDIMLTQGWIKTDLREFMDTEVINPASGWGLPAFASKAAWADAIEDTINREMFNEGIRPEFLTYRQKAASNIQVLRRIKVKGHQDENLVTGSEAVDLNPVEGATPEQNFTFNWDLGKMNKTKMAPIGSGAIADASHVLGFSWLPFVSIAVARRVLESTGSTGGANENRSFLNVKYVDHFTYADS